MLEVHFFVKGSGYTGWSIYAIYCVMMQMDQGNELAWRVSWCERGYISKHNFFCHLVTMSSNPTLTRWSAVESKRYSGQGMKMKCLVALLRIHE